MGNKKYYLTEKGIDRVKMEYEELKKQRREKLKKESPEVFHSEEVNPEYITFRKELGVLEEKISKMEEVLRGAEIIKKPSKGCKEIHVGAEITVDVKGQEDKLTLVGTMEADPSLGRISNESPVGRALLGHKEGDKVTVSSPIQTVYKIKKVDYPSSEE